MTLGIKSSADRRRIFFVGLNTGYVTLGVPDQRFLDFYQRRASPALHSAIIGNVVIPDGVGSNGSTATLSDDPMWRSIAAAIARRGALPGIQLSTAWQCYAGIQRFRAKEPDTVVDASRQLIAAMSDKEINRQLGAFDQATHWALEAKFQHIQLHAAHGYLLSLLLDPAFNARSEHIRTWLTNWVARVAAAGAESSIRISLRTGSPAIDCDDRAAWLDDLSQLAFDYVDVSSGFYNIDKRLIYPGRPDIIAERRDDTIALASRNPGQQFIYSGRALSHATDDLPANVHIGLCRDLIANPDFLQARTNGCVNSGRCHYFSRGKNHVSCSQWRSAMPR
jgi:2,4-dienoyl-CoA reductase-like NADH-dependent reductase (Old Yellow Enzyme family)